MILLRSLVVRFPNSYNHWQADFSKNNHFYMYFSTCFINVCYPNGTNENKMRKHCCLGAWSPYNLNNNLSLNWPITNQISCPDIFTWMDSRSCKICPQVCYIWLYWKKNLVLRILVSFLMEKHLLLNKYTPILF